MVQLSELGQFADNRPFFTMKLVNGKTLAKLLADRSAPSEDQTRFLGIFEQVCQAIAFAHESNVIHRDLKPSNIMVGEFGEVQVMKSFVGLGEGREQARGLPIEPAAINQQAADDDTVTTEDFGRRMHHDIRAQVEWPA